MAKLEAAYDKAEISYQRALALEPGNARAVRGAAALVATLGRFEEAVALDRRAVELDPLNALGHNNLGLAAYYAGRPEEAVAIFKKSQELNPEFPGSHTFLGRVYLAQAHPQDALVEMEREPEPVYRVQGQTLAYHALGRKKEADAALAELVAKYHADDAFRIAEVYGFRGKADRAFDWLERAYAQRDSGLSEVKSDPLLKNLERDPRYAALDLHPEGMAATNARTSTGIRPVRNNEPELNMVDRLSRVLSPCSRKRNTSNGAAIPPPKRLVVVGFYRYV